MFTANAVWAVLAILGAQPVALDRQPRPLATGPVVAKTHRRRCLTIPGRITGSARRTPLHLPARWPWRDAFVELSRLRHITIVQPC